MSGFNIVVVVQIYLVYMEVLIFSSMAALAKFPTPVRHAGVGCRIGAVIFFYILFAVLRDRLI